MVSLFGTLPVLLMYDIYVTREHLKVVEGYFFTLSYVFIIFTVVNAAAVTICNLKTTVIKITIVVIILSSAWEFLLIVHVTIFLLLCLVPSLVWVKLVELLFPNNDPLYAWSLEVATYFAPTFFPCLPIWIMRVYLMLSLICLRGSHGRDTCWIGWYCGYKELCSYVCLWCWVNGDYIAIAICGICWLSWYICVHSSVIYTSLAYIW